MLRAFVSADRDRVAKINTEWQSASNGEGTVWSDDGCVCQRSDNGAWSVSDRFVAITTSSPTTPGARCGEPERIRETSSPLSRPHAIVDAYQSGGLKALTPIVGHHGVLLWDRQHRRLAVLRDPLGVETLYYQEAHDGVFISDRLDGLPHRDTVNHQYIADFIASQGGGEMRGTIWAGIEPIPPGTALLWHEGHVRLEPYWRPDITGSVSTLDMPEAAAEFRRLLERAIVNSIDPGQQTWANLSGGLDSSSIVSLAAAQAEEGRTTRALGGTMTFVDSLSNGDETVFVDAVLRRFGLPNVRLVDDWPWRDDGQAPPVTDQPTRDYPLYARHRAMAAAILGRGGHSVLSGVGADEYLLVSTFQVADLLWRGYVREGLRELYRWSRATNDSVWQKGFRDAVMPLLSTTLQQWRERSGCDVPAWLSVDFARQHDIRGRMAREQGIAGPRGAFYQSAVARNLRGLASCLPRNRVTPSLDVRYPFLDLPLVEFTLGLPFHFRTDVPWSKPVLRRAVKGVLPDEVRRRRTKAGISARICWVFRRERARLARLLSESVLADVRCIEPKRLLLAVDAVANGTGGNGSLLYATLALETWLAVRSGRNVWHAPRTQGEAA